MSAQALHLALPAVPTVLLRTHYGLVWAIRAAAIAGSLLLWFPARRGTGGRVSAYLLLGAALVVAWSFSAASRGTR